MVIPDGMSAIPSGIRNEPVNYNLFCFGRNDESAHFDRSIHRNPSFMTRFQSSRLYGYQDHRFGRQIKRQFVAFHGVAGKQFGFDVFWLIKGVVRRHILAGQNGPADRMGAC